MYLYFILTDDIDLSINIFKFYKIKAYTYNNMKRKFELFIYHKNMNKG